MLTTLRASLLHLLLFCLLLSGCATPPKSSSDPAPITQHLQERLSIEQARARILGHWESLIQDTNSRLTENVSVAKREQLRTDRELLEKDLARARQAFDQKTAGFNPTTDQIWSYRRPGGESGIVLLQNNNTIYLSRTSAE
jgi:outer membrane protein TolC